MIFNRLSIATVLCVSIFFTGCGGGGGDSSVINNPSPQENSTNPTTPSGLTAQAISSTEIELNWNASSDDGSVSGYYVYRDGYLEIVPTTSHSATGLSPSTNYCFSVAAIDNEGNMSPQSEAVCTTTEASASSAWKTVQSWTSATFSGVVWNGSKLLVTQPGSISDSGTVYTSSNGLTWSASSTTGFRGADDLIYDGEQFVAVRESWVYTSTDGITWTSSYVGDSFIDLYSIAWSPSLSRYVSVGESGTIYTSDDGSTWNLAESVPVTTELWNVTWLNDRFFVLSRKGEILTSTNGIDWALSVQTASTYGLKDIAWNGERYVAIGFDSTVTSVDGINWTEETNNPNALIQSIVWAGDSANIFVAVGSNTVYSSPDGLNWTQAIIDGKENTGLGTELHDVTWTGTYFVAVGEYGSIITSEDGNNWSIVASGTDLRGITYDGSQYITVGSTGRMAVSSDTETWDFHYFGNRDFYMNDIIFNGNQYVAVGQTYSLYSEDLITWSDVWSGATTTFTGIIWDGSKFVRTGDRTQTWDGVTLDSVNEPDWLWSGGGYYYDIYWDENIYITVGNNGAVATSPDATEGSWTSQDSNTTYTLRAVTKGNGRFVAVGHHSTIITSDDNGTTWTMRYPTDPDNTSVIYYDLYGVTWTGTQFIAVGYSGMILTSDDGINWTKTYHESYKSLYDVISQGSDIVIVGASGTIIRNNL